MRSIVIAVAVVLCVTAFINTRAAPSETSNIVPALSKLHGQTELQSSTIAQAILDYIINLSSSVNSSGGSHQQAPTSENGKVSHVQDELHDKIPHDILKNILYYYYSSISHDAKLHDYQHGGGADSTQGQKRIWKED